MENYQQSTKQSAPQSQVKSVENGSVDSSMQLWSALEDIDTIANLQEAGAMLASGGIVAFPTETVYGLGADARNTAAVEAVFAAKGRPSDNPLIVHISQQSQLEPLVQRVLPVEQQLMDTFWPGPLTIVMPVREKALSPRVTAGLDTVGVRMPDHPVALALITAAGCPLAAPSANRSGRPSPTTAVHVADDLAGQIDGIVDGGSAGVGVESTVVQVQIDGSILILRPGGITREQLLTAADRVELDPALSGVAAEVAPRAPGMKYAHYAPQGSMSIVIGDHLNDVSAVMQQQLAEAQTRGERTGVLVFDEDQTAYEGSLRLTLGSLTRLEEAANQLYGRLREFDEANITFILAQGCAEEGVGLAVMNRLNKAAGGQMIRV